jgi:hypothetical protein
MSVLNWSGVLSPSAAWHVPEEPAEDLVLEVRDLRMRYGRTDVLSGVSFGARRGEVLALLGPNGAGKTTTIEILEGFRMRSSGQVSVLGTDPAHGGEAWRARIGVVLQSWRDHGKWQVMATLPIGAVLGSLFPSARSAGLLTLAMGGLAAISGVFYPITHLPHWLQWAGQAFPLYWLGLGTRSALLPANLASVEIGHSWRHLATFGVLSAWAVAGLLVAPILLRRVARRESGSSVAARREKVLRQVAG